MLKASEAAVCVLAMLTELHRRVVWRNVHTVNQSMS